MYVNHPGYIHLLSDVVKPAKEEIFYIPIILRNMNIIKDLKSKELMTKKMIYAEIFNRLL
jgi:hypothetical protein